LLRPPVFFITTAFLVFQLSRGSIPVGEGAFCIPDPMSPRARNNSKTQILVAACHAIKLPPAKPGNSKTGISLREMMLQKRIELSTSLDKNIQPRASTVSRGAKKN
jgi:hypothetical protein